MASCGVLNLVLENKKQFNLSLNVNINVSFLLNITKQLIEVSNHCQVDSDEEDNEYNREKYRDDHSNITYLHSKNNKSKSSKKCKRIKVYKYDEKYDQVNDDKDEESYSDDNSCLSTSSCSSDEYDDSSCCYEQVGL